MALVGRQRAHLRIKLRADSPITDGDLHVPLHVLRTVLMFMYLAVGQEAIQRLKGSEVTRVAASVGSVGPVGYTKAKRLNLSRQVLSTCITCHAAKLHLIPFDELIHQTCRIPFSLSTASRSVAINVFHPDAKRNPCSNIGLPSNPHFKLARAACQRSHLKSWSTACRGLLRR